MKIKKVSISAFRAFNKEEDSTFDFTLRDDLPADFISIYASNGFGKTSFYDAVEWCITNKVNRFSRLSTQNEKDLNDLKKQNAEKKEFFLINKDITENQKIFVDVLTDLTQPKTSFHREITDRKFKYDFKAKGENKYFDAVILAQDTINSFLKEERPEERYVRFIEVFPQLNKSNESLQNLRSLINVSNEQTNTLKKEKEELIKRIEQLNIQEDNKILVEINEVIKKLNSYGEELSIINKETFSSNDLDNLTIRLSNSISSLNIEIDKINKQIVNIDLLYNGNSNVDGIIGVVEYSNIKNKQYELESELKIRKNYERKKFLEQKIKDNSNELKKLNNSKGELEKVTRKVDTYDEIRVSNVLQIERAKEILKEKLKEIEADISSKDNSIDLVDLELNKYDDYKKRLDQNIDLIKGNEISKEFERLITDIDTHTKEKEKEESELKNIQKDIDIQTTIEEELKIFFSKGIELVNKPEFATRCPLCTQKYSSKEELLDKILKNDLLSKALKILFNKKTELESSINKILNLIQQKTAEILEKIEDKHKPLKIEKENLSNEFSKLRETKNEIIKHIKVLENIFSSSDDTENEISKLKSSIKLLKTRDQNTVLEFRFSEIIKQVENNIANSDYQLAKKFLEDNGFSLFNSIEELRKRVSEINKTVSDLNKEQAESEKELKSISKLTITEDQSSNNDEKIENLKIVIEKNNRTIYNYEQLIYTDLKFDIKTLSVQQTNEKFSELKDDQKKIIESKNIILQNYKIIENLKEDSSKLLEFETNKNLLKEKDFQLDKTKIVCEHLEQEKKSLQSFLQKKIHSFFHHKLINQIYQKIEPHPDYNEIEFFCDFDDKMLPRLQIFTIDNTGKKSIPSLYFSSAQINILSLSVFLAKAINTVDENGNAINCIFIDDPIQSMDSINILSFVDLFRSLVINFSKQIIISTHEENFHNLLKKKIPVDLFKSKFIEFDSFGKVKRQYN